MAIATATRFVPCRARMSAPAIPPSPYRPEVDGLRAIAVLAVMLFHTGLGAFSGGYLGVDLFFVISGMLITGIVLRERDEGTFSLAGFYMRRVRRILPALLLTMLLAIPPALLLLPDLLENFGQSLVASALMANNVLLWMTTGYWALAGEFKPLMHTWSLGVEEQFYLLGVPLMLLALRRGGRRALVAALTAIALLSLIAAEALSSRHPDMTFLLLPFRAWELALGGLVALLPRERLLTSPAARWIASGGLVAATLPLCLYAEGYAGPTLEALVPAGGCALFLAFGDARQGSGRLLAHPAPVAIGLASYSAYLLHQPLFAYVRAFSLEPPAPITLLATIPLILAASLVSLRFVERPMRDRSRTSDRKVLILCGAGSALAIAVGLALHFSHGLAAWSAELDNRPQDNIAYVDAVRRFEGQPLEPATRGANLLVIGHSFARDFVNMAIESGAVAPERISYAEVLRCDAPLPFSALAQAPHAATVVLAVSFTSQSASCARGWISQLEKAGAGRVLVLGPKQFGWSNSAAMRLPEDRRYTYRASPMPWALPENRALEAALPRGSFINMMAAISDEQGKVPLFTPDRRLISQDGLHLTPAGARWLGGIIFALPQFDGVTGRG